MFHSFYQRAIVPFLLTHSSIYFLCFNLYNKFTKYKGEPKIQSRKKTIQHMISIVTGSITDITIWDKYNIDTLINAANPTLMGSRHGVDGSIHSMFNQYLKEKYNKEKFFFFKPDFKDTLNKNICSELKTTDRPRFIRCKRGEAITTDGYGLSNVHQPISSALLSCYSSITLK